MNECIEQLDNCDDFAQCINLRSGGFECRCLEGYEGDGRLCSGMDHLCHICGIKLYVCA